MEVKRPHNADRPFPWQCHHCGKREVLPARIDYPAEVRHDGLRHTFTVPNLEIPICKLCGEKVFTADVDRQINQALRLHLASSPE